MRVGRRRDLKLDNTLLDASRPPRVKLCDFGFAKTFDKADANMFTLIGCALQNWRRPHHLEQHCRSPRHLHHPTPPPCN